MLHDHCHCLRSTALRPLHGVHHDRAKLWSQFHSSVYELFFDLSFVGGTVALPSSWSESEPFVNEVLSKLQPLPLVVPVIPQLHSWCRLNDCPIKNTFLSQRAKIKNSCPSRFDVIQPPAILKVTCVQVAVVRFFKSSRAISSLSPLWSGNQKA
jgi:hypothetical protein